MKVETIPYKQQLADVQATTDPGMYEILHGVYFKESDHMGDVHAELAKPEFRDAPDDLYRMMGLVAILFAQYGFTKMEGQKIRHERKKWGKSFLDPRHLLAAAVYAADLNQQSYPYKETRVKTIDDPELVPVVHGLHIPVYKGELTDYNMSGETVHALLESRATIGIPVALPGKNLNRRLAAIGFTGDQADTMSGEDFRREVLPKANKVLRKIVRPTDIYVAAQRVG